MKLDHKDETQFHVSEEFDNINVMCMWMRFLHMDDDDLHPYNKIASIMPNTSMSLISSP
jgi:hypothetical protein